MRSQAPHRSATGAGSPTRPSTSCVLTRSTANRQRQHRFPAGTLVVRLIPSQRDDHIIGHKHQIRRQNRQLSAQKSVGVAARRASNLLLPGPPVTHERRPAPEVEYVYDVMVRRHYNFPNDDAISYGHGICDKVSQGESYVQVMSAVKSDVTPNDEFAANYLVSYAVNLLCPAQIWQLRNSAAHY
jgi:Protein of unknown function (DUF732)